MINTDVLRVMNARGAGDALIRRMCHYLAHTSNYDLRELCESQKLIQSIGIDYEVARNIYNAKDSSLRLQDELQENQVDMCWYGDEKYPEGIRTLKSGNIPSVLFYKGNFHVLDKKCVGFTGSRNVSDSGIRITDESAKQFAKDDITVVSGYAKGVDITAHRAALQMGGNTVFVMVEGILKSKLKGEVKELINEDNHLFVSQFPPNTVWTASNAMKRNNTIIGLSDAMMLIESGMDGGTFNAGEQSLKNHKPLFVVEYGVPKPTAEGNKYFIDRGGVPIRGDKNGKPILKRVYATLEKEKQDDYEQLKLEI